MPAEVIGILLSHLKPEVYLANDLVVRAGDFGDCLYFIGYGTVAVYSLKGAEVIIYFIFSLVNKAHLEIIKTMW